MTPCKQCGEPLANAEAACPVCAALGRSDDEQAAMGESETMPEEKQGDNPGGSLLGAGPVLGGGAAPESNTPPPPPPPLPPASDDYQQRFDEAAMVFGSDAFTIKRIEKLRAKGMPAVLFLGQRTTGKTWLLQRMKEILRHNFTPSPKLAVTEGEGLTSEEVQARDEEEYRNNPDGPENSGEAEVPKVALTPQEQLVRDEAKAAGRTERSDAIVIHKFLARQGSFALIDVPGEEVRKFVDGEYGGLRGFMAALQYVNVIIVALPADQMLLCSDPDEDGRPEWTELAEKARRDNQQISLFEDALLHMASARSLLRKNNIEVRWKDINGPADEYDRVITPEGVEDHLDMSDPVGGPDGMQCPTFFALTKADKFFAAVDSLPDCAHVGTAKNRSKFEKGNENLSGSAEGLFLQNQFKDCVIQEQMELDANRLLVRMMDGIFGKRATATQLSNPPEMVMQARPVLFNRLTDNFPMGRYDLLSAFYGHTGNKLKMSDFTRIPATGVEELIRWLQAIHTHGINRWHIRARRVFAKTYAWKLRRFGVYKEEVHAPGLRFAPASWLAKMFRKEFHFSQWMPGVLAAAGGIALLAAIWNPLDRTDRVDNGLYQNLVKVIGSRYFGDKEKIASDKDEEAESLQAFVVLEASYSGNFKKWGARPYKNPLDKLTGWQADPDREAVVVKSDFSQPFELPPPPEMSGGKVSEDDWAAAVDLRDRTVEWQSRYVCNLEGWGDYREIIRKAALNGYGECSTLQKFAMRSPLIDAVQSRWPGYGIVLGYALLLLGFALVFGLAYFAYWFAKTRKAYAWLYHSGVATTRRRKGANG